MPIVAWTQRSTGTVVWLAVGVLILRFQKTMYLTIIPFGLMSKRNQILRKRPASTARLTPRMPLEAGSARKVIADAVSNGSINRSIGT